MRRALHVLGLLGCVVPAALTLAACNASVSNGGPVLITQQSAPVAQLAVTQPAVQPATAQVRGGDVRVPLLGVRLFSSFADVSITSLRVRTQGTVVASDVPLVELAVDRNQNGVLDGTDTICAQAAFTAGTTGAVANLDVTTFFTPASELVIPVGQSGDLLVLVTFATGAQAGHTVSISLDGADVSALETTSRKAISPGGRVAGFPTVIR